VSTPVHKLFDLSGQVALVTGGSRGLGLQMAEALGEAGAKIMLCSRKAADLEEAAAELSAKGIDARWIAADASKPEDVQRVVDQTMQQFGQIDILINNAGATWGAPAEDYPLEAWDKVMNLNVKTPFFLTKALAAPLRAAASAERPAKVINIASIDGIFVNPLETYSYQASKAAVIHLTRRMAAKLIKENIVVTAIAPGAFESDMNTAARDHGDAVAASVPAKRIGTPEDMAGVAIYLASRAGDYVVGNTIAVDGGIVYASAGLPVAGEAI